MVLSRGREIKSNKRDAAAAVHFLSEDLKITHSDPTTCWCHTPEPFLLSFPSIPLELSKLEGGYILGWYGVLREGLVRL